MSKGKLLKRYIQSLCGKAHSIYRQNNFWDPKSDQEIANQIQKELSGAMSSILNNYSENTHIEVSDCIIKIIDFCETRDINVIDAFLNKNKKSGDL
jgi:hypothetical protein